jgi:uncharacterized cupredoxin-like copper-binding protein
MITHRAGALLGTATIAVALMTSACGGGSVETGTVPGVAGGHPRPGAPTVRVTASNFEFTPEEIEIGAKEETTLVLHSGDGSHDFAVDGLGRVAAVGGGATDRARLRIDAPGRYTFFCTLPGHRDGGMEGTVLVTRSTRNPSPGQRQRRSG